MEAAGHRSGNFYLRQALRVRLSPPQNPEKTSRNTGFSLKIRDWHEICTLKWRIAVIQNYIVP